MDCGETCASTGEQHLCVFTRERVYELSPRDWSLGKVPFAKFPASEVLTATFVQLIDFGSGCGYCSGRA